METGAPLPEGSRDGRHGPISSRLLVRAKMATMDNTPPPTPDFGSPAPVLSETAKDPADITLGDAVVEVDDIEEELESDKEPPAVTVTAPDGNVYLSAVKLPFSTLITPASMYHIAGDKRLIPYHKTIPEWLAVKRLAAIGRHLGINDEYPELHDFCIYIDNSNYKCELRSLHLVAAKRGHATLYLDGCLKYPGSEEKFRVRRVPFNELSIGNYGLDSHAVSSKELWIRSCHNRSRNIYYQLADPAIEYGRFFIPFLWLANLAKHVVDYLKENSTARIGIEDFGPKFSNFLLKHHRRSDEFNAWFAQCRQASDFRSIIANYSEFLWKEAFGVMGEEAVNHPLWDQVIPGSLMHVLAQDPMKGQQFIIEAKILKNGEKRDIKIYKTTCTRFVYRLFKDLPFQHLLQDVQPCVEVRARRKQQLVKFFTFSGRKSPEISARTDNIPNGIAPGMLISTHPDVHSHWKMERSKGFVDDALWYGLVQRVDKSRRRIDVIWMYKPSDTMCAVMRYPYRNELFISNHCSCYEPKTRFDQVLGTHTVEWGGTPETEANFFVRQRYDISEKRWVNLQDNHLRCPHLTSASGSPGSSSSPCPYLPGDTVLAVQPEITPAHKERLEAFEVMTVSNDESSVMARWLPRRAESDPNGKDALPNELVYSDDICHISIRDIKHPCYVRFFPQDSPVLPPYDLKGTANYFFLRCGPAFENLASAPTSLKQGFDPSLPIRKLRGLDLFCGGGNLGRGLEEGGAVKNEWCNDFWGPAIHTYVANEPNNQVKPYLGSCDDLLYKAMMGEGASNIPAPGDVDQISGGSPCQGFSILTHNKTTVQQRKNQSMVASFCSFIDFYRPMYGVLENVPAIIQSEAHKDCDVFSQMVCAIVGMGYQCQMGFLDAWSFGAPQSRSRIFLIFARPDVKLPERPISSHSHPRYLAKNNTHDKLGKLSNGQSFARRDYDCLTAFKYVSAREATTDLPDIGDGKPGICTSHPDHRLSIGVTSLVQCQMEVIPFRPYGMNFSKMLDSNTMTAYQRSLFPEEGKSRVNKQSRGYGRVDPRKLFQTASTTCVPSDAFTGTWTHWEQPRPISIMEVKRAQGFRDTDVLIGHPSQQWKIVGNSVARQVAVAVGLSIREAFYGSNVAGMERDVTVLDSHLEVDVSEMGDEYSEEEEKATHVEEEDGPGNANMADYDGEGELGSFSVITDEHDHQETLKRQNVVVEIVSPPDPKRARVSK
ncbi:hypothetical protein MKZ38_009203 [Zalerion maritima]|uniref:DNA (cytosine-5-)-methyltransferase n=1 Tax=Zalerion maritima TaxID=339359 RepID=A0AAD5RGE0_9PEZI|nr:hypothetical protein MKZ38_009203 [Zalerion maritima]